SERIFDAPYCVDNDRFGAEADTLTPRRAQLRHEWGVADDAVVVLFSGKLVEKKHPLDLVSALALGRRKDPRLHLLVAGDGVLRPACQEAARVAGLPATFLGFVNQRRIAEAYVAADCLALPSDWGETWGLVVNEAMACGRAAIVSDRVGCYPDLVVPGQTGAVFRFGDVEQFAEAILAAAAIPGNLATLGARARRHVLD